MNSAWTRRGARKTSRFTLATARLLALVSAFSLGTSLAQTGPRVIFERPGIHSPAPDNTIVLPSAIPDPIEGVNRRLFAFNKAAMTGVVKPSAKVYRGIVLPPLRVGIANIGRNLLYPKRVLNNLLQARWEGAGDETSRFLCNSVLGIGGIFDIASRWDIPASEADFGQTLGVWGWRPGLYLMIPILGPSNERDALGSAADSAVNPLTYFSPYSYIPWGITYNNLTDTVDEYVRLSKTEADPYYVLQYTSSFQRDRRPVDLSLKGEQDFPSLETLNAVFFSFKNRNFPQQGKTRSVLIPATGRELPYRYWLQPKKAPVVYIQPGVGSHRLNGGAIALAELLYAKGFSAVTVSSAYNYEFMERASTADMPGYAPVDAHDIHVALTRIDEDLQREHPDRLGSRALVGYSMGGFHTMMIASATDTNKEPLLAFDRYVAIDTPVRLLNGIAVLDRYFATALDWPKEERAAEVENTFVKVAALARKPPAPGTPPPFNARESQFLVGLAFRLNLRDMIFTSETRHNHGVLKTPIDEWKRDAVYREIIQYSFLDYLNDFVAPYYKTRGIDLTNEEVLARGEDLRPYVNILRENSRIRLIENRNDILLTPEDISWLQATFPTERLRFFEHGGHLGNLMDPEVQEAIVASVQDLREAQ